MGDIPEDRLCITTDNPERTSIAAKTAAIVMLTSGMAAVVVPVWDYVMAAVKTTGHWANMVVWCPMGTWCVAYILRFLLSPGLSTWELDSEGIAFQGPRGGRRYLPWRDVERVRWSVHGVRVLGRGERIDLYWKQLKPETHAEAARAFLHFLGKDFALPTGEVLKWPERLALFLKIIAFFLWCYGCIFVAKHGTPLLLTALLPALAHLVRLLPFLRDMTLLTYFGLAVFLAVVMVLISPALILMGRSEWFDRRVN